MQPNEFTSTDVACQQLLFVWADGYIVVKDNNNNELGNLSLGDQKALVGFIINKRTDLKAFINRMAWVQVTDTQVPADALQVIAFDQTTKRQYIAEHDSKALVNDWFDIEQGKHLDNVTHYMPKMPDPAII